VCLRERPLARTDGLGNHRDDPTPSWWGETNLKDLSTRLDVSHHHGEYSSALSRTAPARATLSGRRLLFFFPRPCPWRPTRARPDKVEGDGAGAAPSTYRAMLSGKTGPLLYCKCSTLPTAKAGQSLDDTADKGSTGETFIYTVRTNEILQPLAAAKGACNAMQA
jgi:hypothetical protein